MRRIVFALTFLLFACCAFRVAYAADKKPKRYVVNLDMAPEERWTHIVREHMDVVPLVIKEAKRFIPTILQRPFFWLAEKVSRYFPDDYNSELKGVANASGLPLGEIVGINLLYDITDFQHTFFPHIACTSIVAEDAKGRILHARNLDYDMSELLRDATVIVDFKRDEKVLFSATTFVLQVGTLTGQKPHVFSASLNARYSGGIFDNIFMEIYTRFRNLVAFEIRRAFEEAPSFEDAVQRLSRTHFIAPSYITIGGTKSGEGAIVTRNRWSAADVYRLNASKGRWYLLETNFDHWKKSDDPRRKLGKRYMNAVGRANISPSTIFAVISKNPVLNEDTIFSTVMSAGRPELMYNFTRIRNV